MSMRVGHSRDVVHCSTPVDALVEARAQVAHGAKEVSIRINAISKDYMIEAFASSFVNAVGWQPTS